MRNNSKILILLIVVVFVLACYIAVSVEHIEVNVNTENLKTAALKKDHSKEQDLEKIRINHTSSLNTIFSDCEQIVKEEATSSSEQNLNKVKDKLASLVAPSENFKMIHLNLALSLSNYEDYIKSGLAEQRVESLRHFENAILEFKKLDNDNS